MTEEIEKEAGILINRLFESPWYESLLQTFGSFHPFHSVLEKIQENRHDTVQQCWYGCKVELGTLNRKHKTLSMW